MSTDAGSPITPEPPPSPDLPRLRGLRIRRIRFEAPELEHFRSSLTDRHEAVEFLVETEAPVPVRAYGPALFIGDVEVNQSERLGDTTWRILAFDTDLLRPHAAIRWGWMKDPEEVRQNTQFRYEPEDAE